MIIGITGGTGSGKTTLLQLIEQLGGTVIDCDAVYHRLLQTDPSLTKAIGQRFPTAVDNGTLHTKVLGNIVFADKDALNDLNRITHSAVSQEVKRLLSPAPKLAAIDAIALFESGLNTLCDATVAVTAPTELRIKRLMARDGITEAYARARIAAQRPDGDFQTLCQYNLVNDGSDGDFRQKCLAFFAELGIMNLDNKYVL